MDAAHRRALTKNARLLNKDLLVDEDFLAVFEEKAIFTQTNTEEIKSKGSKSGMSSAFRNLLPMRGPKAFPTFIEALVETGQDHIAQTLDPAVATKLIGDRDISESSVDGASKLSTSGPTHPVQPARSIVDKGEPLITMDILDVDPTTAKRLLADSEHVYSMKSAKRGRAIILNNEYFVTNKLSDREGSAEDATNLDRLFNKLSFEADTWGNLTSKEIENKIEEERTHAAHKDADAFIFTILSHGNRGNIFGTDGELVDLEKSIFTKFDGKHCPNLNGKPKMFFIQACQGAFESKITSDSGVNKEEPVKEQVDPRMLQVDTSTTIPNIHEKADFILAYATVPGYVSWRDTVEGTWFIRDLIYTFMERCHTDHLADMLLEVNRKAQKRTNYRSKVRQVSETRSSANKKIYFLPGYSE